MSLLFVFSRKEEMVVNDAEEESVCKAAGKKKERNYTLIPYPLIIILIGIIIVIIDINISSSKPSYHPTALI